MCANCLNKKLNQSTHYSLLILNYAKNHFYTPWLLTLYICWLLMGCAGTATIGQSSANQLQERVNLRWQALIKKDWDTAYQFQMPSYRQLFNVRQFQFKFGRKPEWKAVQIDNVTINEHLNTADIKLTITHDYYTEEDEVIKSKIQVNEHWTKHDNQWWIVD